MTERSISLFSEAFAAHTDFQFLAPSTARLVRYLSPRSHSISTFSQIPPSRVETLPRRSARAALPYKMKFVRPFSFSSTGISTVLLRRQIDCPLLWPPLSYVTCASYYVTLPHCIFWDREFLLFTTFLPPFLPAFRSSCIALRFQPHYPILKAASFSWTIAENSFSVRAAFFKFQIETPDDESLFNRYFVRIFSSLFCFFAFSDTTLIRFTRDDNAADLLTPPLPVPLPPPPTVPTWQRTFDKK